MSVPVLENGKVIAQVDYNDALDYWDGHNYTCGSTGRHLGYTRLKSGKWVLIHGSQWQGEQNSAEVVTAEELVQAAARTGNLDELYKTYPDLKTTLPDEEENTPEVQEMEAEVVSFGNGAHIVIPKGYIGKKISYRFID
jgi:hypothetical protein